MKKLLLIFCLSIGFTVPVIAQLKQGADPAVKAKKLQKALALSDRQTEKITSIYNESFHKFDEIKTKDNGETNEMLKDIAPLRILIIKKIKAVLNANQVANYDRLLKHPEVLM